VENALREYLVKVETDVNSTREKPGDTAARSDFYETYDGVFGSVFPRFFHEIDPAPR